MLYAFFWVIPRRLKFICRRFGTLCLFHLHRQVGACRMNSAEDKLGYYTGKGLTWAIRTGGTESPSVLMAPAISKPNLFPYNTPACPQPSSFYTHLPAYEDGTECSETSAYKFQTPGNHPKESIQQVQCYSRHHLNRRRVQPTFYGCTTLILKFHNFLLTMGIKMPETCWDNID